MGLDSPALDLPHSPRVRRAMLRGGVGRALPAAQAERHTTLWLALSFGKGEFGIARSEAAPSGCADPGGRYEAPSSLESTLASRAAGSLCRCGSADRVDRRRATSS